MRYALCPAPSRRSESLRVGRRVGASHPRSGPAANARPRRAHFNKKPSLHWHGRRRKRKHTHNMHALGTAAAAAAEEEEVALRRVRRRRRRRRLSYTQVLGASVHPSPPHRPGGPRSTAAASHSSTCIQPIKTDLMMKVSNDVIRTLIFKLSHRSHIVLTISNKTGGQSHQ